METILFKMLVILAWIGAFAGTIWGVLSLIMHIQYQDSLEKRLDAMRGVRKVYGSHIRWGLGIGLLSIIFLYCK